MAQVYNLSMRIRVENHAKSTGLKRGISTCCCVFQRVKQTENEIVQMFQLGVPNDEIPKSAKLFDKRKNCSLRTDKRFVRILKLFKWGPDAEKALDVFKLKVDRRLVREILQVDVDINVKKQFFKWTGKRRNYEHDSTTYMALIRCLEESGLVGGLWRMIQDMVKSSCAISPAELSEIVRILGWMKMVDKALAIFYQIKNRNCKPSSSTYNSIILMLMREGCLEKVHELYNEMCLDGDCFPDALTYSALMSAFSKLGRVDFASRLFNEMKENELNPNPKIYTTLLAVYFKLGKVETALGLVKEMIASG